MNKTVTLSILTAVGASLCCTGPLLLLLFGSTAFGTFGLFEHIRPYTSVLTIGLLGFAYFNVFNQKKNSDCCETDKEIIMNKQKKQKRLLMMVTPIIVGLLLFPYYGDILYGQTSKTEAQKTVVDSEWKIEGMTCQGCSKGLEGGLSATEGISSCKVDFASGSMVCVLDEKILNKKDIPGLVKKMGYKASLKKGSDKKILKAGILGLKGQSFKIGESCCAISGKTS